MDRGGCLDDYAVNFVTVRQGHTRWPRCWPGCRGTPARARTGIPAGRPDHRHLREEIIEAGDAFSLPPGHVPSAAGGTEFLQFSPAAQLAEVRAAMMATAQRLAPEA
jgi:hypothetical protein